jgi:FkbM family methyltransferase
MKFIFVESFDLQWNGYSARYEKGISGSHNAIMYLAEGLTKIGHCVEIVSINNNLIEGNYYNVQYTNFNNFEYQSCDYIIVTPYLFTLNILDKISSYKKIIILTHFEIWPHDKFYNIDKNKIIIGFISEFAKTNILNLQPFLKDYENIILYNSFDTNDIINIPFVENKQSQLCFFACHNRGYNMAVEVVKKLDNYQLISNTYNNHIRYLYCNDENKLKMSDNTSKYSIYNIISESKYFVYPLINLDNNEIHYDTFGYVVLEALLLGCIVIVPKIKIYEELFGDAVCYIETDDIIPVEDLLYWRKTNANFGIPILNRYVEKIKLLDENEELRKSYIEKGKSLKNKFSNTKIACELVNYLQNNEYKIDLENHLRKLSNLQCMPINHWNYLQKLKAEGFEPNVIYDIGSCVLHWTKEAKKLWPNAKYILFDAFSPAEFLYKEYDYHVGVLSNEDGNLVKFYQNDYYPTGNSYYREIGCLHGNFFPEDKYVEMISKKIDTIVKERGFPLPDFVKIDVQGAEVDIIKGGINTFKNASRMIIELQDTEYNQGALKKDVSLPLIENLLGFKCTDPLFQNNGPDGDYGFINPTKIN